MSPRRRHRPFSIYRLIRAAVATLVVVGLIGVLSLGAAILLIDPNAYKPEIEAAVRQATGRTLALRGAMRLAFGLRPRLIAEDVTFADSAEISHQAMLTLERTEARIAPWPLLSGAIDIDDLTLVHPDLRLERDGNGRGNWLFVPSTPSDGAQAVSSASQAVPATRPNRARVAVRAIHIEAGRISWRAGPDVPVIDLLLPHIDAFASGPDGTLLLTGTVGIKGRNLKLNGEIGPLDRLFDRARQPPWPVFVSLQDGGIRLSVSGSFARPSSGRGPLLRFDASVSDFTGLEAFLPPGVVSPHEATATVHWGDGSETGDIGLTGLALHVGDVRLPALLPGVEITQIDIAAPALDRPAHVDIRGEAASGGTLRLVANVAQLKSLLPGATPADPVPIDATLNAGRAVISAKGTATDLTALRGVDLDLIARLPDSAAFGALAGRPLPPLTQLAFEGHVIGDLMPAGVIGLRHATLTLPEAEVSGDADIRLGPRPYVHAVVSSQRIDLDSLLAGLSPSAPAADLPAAASPVPAPPSAPPTTAAPARWLIPDEPLDLQALDRFDTDVRFRVDSLQLGGVGYSQVSGTVTLRDGKLVVDPLSGMMPGGAAETRLSIASRAPEMPVSLYLRLPSLQLAPLLAGHVAATGTLGIDADLQGAGRSLHAIAGSLNGHIGVASTDSEVDNRIVVALLKAARIPGIALSPAGTAKLRCLVLRLDISKGIVTIEAMIADLQRLVLMGGGSFDLGREELGVQLRPMLRVGAGGGVVVPVRVGGTFLAPKASVGVEAKGGPPITGAGTPDPCATGLKVVFAVSPDSAKPTIPVPEVTPPQAPARAGSVIDVLKGLIK
ncbi:MAG: AsmA family protein [Rhodopila sp.]|nr:AsmA family protein [Rhodopila sp.]